MSEKPCSVTIVFGDSATRRYAEGENSLEKLAGHGSVETFGYDTQAELDAFIEGLDAMNGWMDYCVYMGDEEV